MGDETIQIASRFSLAVSALARLAGEAAPPPHLGDRARDEARVRDALDAVAAVHEAGTDAVRDWPEQRKRVLAQVARVREALLKGGLSPEVRRLAGALVELIGPPAGAP